MAGKRRRRHCGVRVVSGIGGVSMGALQIVSASCSIKTSPQRVAESARISSRSSANATGGRRVPGGGVAASKNGGVAAAAGEAAAERRRRRAASVVASARRRSWRKIGGGRQRHCVSAMATARLRHIERTLAANFSSRRRSVAGARQYKISPAQSEMAHRRLAAAASSASLAS